MMKLQAYFILALLLAFQVKLTEAQDAIIGPSAVITGRFLGETPPLRDLPPVTAAELAEMELKAKQKMLNPGLKRREYPYAATALPKGPDQAWQRTMGANRDGRAPLTNFGAQTVTTYYPPDCNGTAGPAHYMQTVNTTYSIYNKSGTLLAGPTNLNTLFNGVTGSTYNDGDPIVLYDEQADRWFVAEFSISGSNDYMLMAVSTTNDPTGTWYAYSFDVADTPDYMKFGVWRDGYYMATNTYNGADIYVFERSQMLIGGTARGVAFDNPNRPTTIDGFVVVPPLDNDGPFAPEGSPGIFIAFNDDAIGGGSDQLWIFELDADWTTPTNSTFSRVQQIAVTPFDSNFGMDWDNIAQPNTTRQLDAIPMVIMNPPQYRNFSTHQTIVCCHTVDVDNTDHAGIRWYELQKTGSSWTIRQQGTYAPDEHSRWMGSIMMNNAHEIALGYSISSATVYPGIRYCGQSAADNAAATNTLGEAEQIIQTGSYSQSPTNRWGDYSSMQLDPIDDETFWYTNQYVGSSGQRLTKVANFQIGTPVIHASFVASNTHPLTGSQVNFTDLSTGLPTSWNWTFTPSTITYLNGTTATSRNPQVSFNVSGYYTVSLYAANASGNDTETRTNYILAYSPGTWTGAASTDWYSAGNWEGDVLPTSTTDVVIPSNASNWPVHSGDFTVGTQCGSLSFQPGTEMTVNGGITISKSKTLNMTSGGALSLTGNWQNNGNFLAGNGSVEFTGNGTASVAVPVPDITGYTRSMFAGGMTALTGGIVGPTGDDGAAVVPINFTFVYLGVGYTNLKFCTNGWVSLNQSGTVNLHLNTSLFTASTPNTTLAPWWDDLKDDNPSKLYYLTQGSAPNRVFTAEWNQVLSYSNGSSTRMSFQVKLYETTNVIEFHYGTVTPGNQSANESASIGVEDATGGSGHFIEATTGSSTTGVTTLVYPANWPSQNYRFTPPVPQAAFNDLIINNSGGTLTFNVNTVIGGGMTVMPGASFRVATGKSLDINGDTSK